MHGGVRKCPVRRSRPVRALKLVLDIEQPDPRGSGNENDRQMDYEERDDPHAPDEQSRRYGDGEVGRHGRDPRQRPRAHHAERQPLLEEEQKGGANAEHDKWISIKAIAKLSPRRQIAILRDREGRDVADTTFVEITS